ncbi:hypothetical protein OM960_15640 [Defluviimonas sp. CAU 1641]|uniref:Uncharacterized protein n=2 Tax=Defluviimonas salinarum TaxID=2992147 RepID=A0ABT3J5P1_9RHOB|nr:hypothetical protein [Defluviimonas salinarum]
MESNPEASAQMMDGLITIGPVKGINGTDFLRRMLKYNLHVARDEGAAYSARGTRDGFVITAQGPGVLGYLVDRDGLEASRSDLEDFARRLIAPGQDILIEGWHMTGDDEKLLCRTVICHGGDMVTVTPIRKLIGAGALRRSAAEPPRAGRFEFEP